MSTTQNPETPAAILRRRTRLRDALPIDKVANMNKPTLYPLCFEPVYKDYIWGGDRIPTIFGREAPPGLCAESWEISDRSEGMSAITNGPLTGRSLEEVIHLHGSDLLGSDADHFPLLIKLIDARQTLSIQVHPDDETAARYGGEAKTEMWYILDAEPGAVVYAGFQPGAKPDRLKQSIRDGTVEDLLNVVPVHSGDAIFMPGGRVHAIGAGCLILEVQQNSNTTYRLYDWGRTGVDGKPRELHVEESLRVIRWDDSTPPRATPRRLVSMDGNALWEITSCPYFRMERLELTEPWDAGNDGRSFHALFAMDAPLQIRWEDQTQTLARGTTTLIPACISAYQLIPDQTPCTVLRVTCP